MAEEKQSNLFYITLTKLSVLILFLSLCLAITVPCESQEKGPRKTQGATGELGGTIRVSGAWALYPMAVRWGEEFKKVHAKVKIDISAGGAGKGIADVLGGLVDIGMVSREITSEEMKQGAFYLPVVKDAVFPTLSEKNPLLKNGVDQIGMKKQAFIDLWIKDKGLTWGDATGLASTQKVHVYTRSDSCGAAQTWAQYLGEKNQEDLQGIGVYGDPGLAEAVRKDPLGIGYNNLNYAYDYKTGFPIQGVRIISIDINNNGKIDVQEDLKDKAKALKAVSSGIYPSPPARELFLVSRVAFKGLARDFMRWILTDGQRFVEENGYVRLSQKRIDETLRKLGD
ncbi:MAG TPA: substrate-binding domain-containing protein [Thermodesulfobacteriota bacterium]|nr:substrate-binding domain-containing protein [Thermodesulfobacteriota bacterium]